MDPNWRHPYGLRPTLRQLMILVLHFALLFALTAPLLKSNAQAALALMLPLSPLLCSLLVIVFDRTSPAKYWLAGILIALCAPALVGSFDILVMEWWWPQQQNPAIMVTLLIANACGFVLLVRVAHRLPARCPECTLRSWLPLGRSAAPHYWCASCGFTERCGRPARGSTLREGKSRIC
jgi:hypothetical protein